MPVSERRTKVLGIAELSLAHYDQPAKLAHRPAALSTKGDREEIDARR
jgi:hypothetical protein